MAPLLLGSQPLGGPLAPAAFTEAPEPDASDFGKGRAGIVLRGGRS